MADKYDAFLDGPDKYDAFLDEPTPKAAPVANDQNKYATTAEGQGFFTNLAAGAGGAVEGWMLGLRQLLGRNPTEAEIQEYKAAMSGLRGTAGGVIGEIGANLIPGGAAVKGVSAIPRVAGALGAGGTLGTAANIGLGGTIGAAEGAMTPVGAEDSRATNVGMGGLMGGGGSIVGALFSKGYQGFKNNVMPFFSPTAAKAAGGRMLNEAVGDQSGDIIRAMRTAPPTISPQNAGQAAIEAASPEFSAMQQLTNRMTPKPAADLARTQVAGRQAEIGSFAKTEADLAAAEAARAANSATNYGKALSQSIKGDSELGSILRDPYVKDTFPEIVKLVQARQAAGQTVPLGEQLMMIKKELDKTLRGTPTNTPSSNQTRAITDIQDRLNTWMKTKVPGFEAAATQYAKESKDIFQMSAGQRIQQILEKPLGGAENAASLARAVRDETGIIKKSGGFAREGLEDQLTPTNYAKVQNVLNELDIDARFNDLAKKGAGSQKVAGAVGSGINLPNLMNSAVAITNGAIKRIAGGGKIKSLEQLSAVMQDPIATAALMEAATQQEKNAIKFLTRAMQTGAIGSAAYTKGQQ